MTTTSLGEFGICLSCTCKKTSRQEQPTIEYDFEFVCKVIDTGGALKRGLSLGIRVLGGIPSLARRRAVPCERSCFSKTVRFAAEALLFGAFVA